MAHSMQERVAEIWMSVVLGMAVKRSRSSRTRVNSQRLLRCRLGELIVPSLAVFAFAKDERVERLEAMRLARSFAFFVSRYSSPRPTRAVSYCRRAASLEPGAFDSISL